MATSASRPLDAALAAELVRFERAAVRVWTIVVFVMMLSAIAYAGAVQPLVGLGMTVVSAIFVGWYVWLGWRLGRGPAGAGLEAAIVVAEVAFPWLSLGVLVLARGADYAIGSWLPPMLFCGNLVSNAVQMRPHRAIANGIGSALLYVLAYFLWMRVELPSSVGDALLYGVPTQLTRAVSLLAGGIAAAAAARALRNMINRAGVLSRQRDLFGKYRLEHKLASGGMGTVHEAVYCPEGGFERRVAVKRIHPHLAEIAKFVEAFRREAELSARLLHPNIVQVMDFGRVEDRYFLSMEFVDGAPLADLMARARHAGRTLSCALVGYLAAEMLAGLDYAHRGAVGADGHPLRVVHRDVCPQNVLISNRGHVKISDFGVARALEDGGSALTQSFVGHVGYVAPEQAGGEHEIDERADLFPLGVILWELLAGRPLFARRSSGATIHAVLTAELPDLASLRPDLDPAWVALVTRALERDPDARWRSARDMSAALLALDGVDAVRGARELVELFDLPAAPAEPDAG
ncbi:MAG: serine/threonine-protein kinase [Sandaracinaceae bacterium]